MRTTLAVQVVAEAHVGIHDRLQLGVRDEPALHNVLRPSKCRQASQPWQAEAKPWCLHWR